MERWGALLGIATGEIVDLRSPCLAWLIEHAGRLLNLCHRGGPHDGFTPYERRSGNSWKTEFPPFGAVVKFQRMTDYKLERRWQGGVFLGIILESTERIVGTAVVVYDVRSIRGSPPMYQHASELLH